MTKSRLLSAIAACGIAALLSHPASAASILIDQGNNTLDPSTHLDWLDLTLTANHSYDDVVAGFGNYTTTGGYHVASMAELAQLFTDAGGSGTYPETGVSDFASNSTYDAAFNLLSLLGATGTLFANGGQTDHRASSAFVSDGPGGGAERYATILANYDFSEWTGKLMTSAAIGLSNSAGSGMSTFLVKSVPVSSTPVPASLPLFMTALVGLGFGMWRRKTRA